MASQSSSRQNQGTNVDDSQRNVSSPFSPGGTYWTPGGGMQSYPPGTAPSDAIYVPPKVTTPPKSSGGGGSGGGGGGGGGGYSYISPETGKGYEVSPTGEQKEIIPVVSVAPAKGNTIASQLDLRTESRIEPLKDYGWVETIAKPKGIIPGLLSFGLFNIGDLGSASVKNLFWGKTQVSFKTPYERIKEKTAKVYKETGDEYSLYPQEIAGGLIMAETSKQEKERIMNLADLKFEELQGQVYAETIPVEAAQESYKAYTQNLINPLSQFIPEKETALSKFFPSQNEQVFSNIIGAKAEKKFKESSGAFAEVETAFQGWKTVEQYRNEYAPLALETAAIIAAPEFALPAIGAKDAILGGMNQDIFQAAGGLFFAGGSATSGFRKQAARLAYELPLERNLAGLSKTSFKAAEVRMEKEFADLSLVRGSREFGTFKENIEFGGKVLKKDEFFFQPGSKGVSTITGVVQSEFPLGKSLTSPKFFLGGTKFEVGAKGFSLPIGEGEKFSLSLGKANVIKLAETSAFLPSSKSSSLMRSLNKNFKSFESGESYSKGFFMGVSKQIKEDLYFTRAGKISSAKLVGGEQKLFVGSKKSYGRITLKSEEGILVKGKLKDWIVTKTFPGEKFKPVTVFETSKSGLDSGLIMKQVTKKPSSSGLISTTLLKESRVTIPKINSQSLVSKNMFKGGFSSSNIMGKQGLQYRTKFSNQILTSSLTKLKTEKRFKQTAIPSLASGLETRQQQGFAISQASLQGLKTMQKSMSPLAFKVPARGFTPRTKPPTDFFFGGGFAPLGIPSLGLGLGIAPSRRKKKRKKGKAAPSFTAEVFNLKGTFPKSGAFGISPFQIRKIPRGRGNPYETKF